MEVLLYTVLLYMYIITFLFAQLPLYMYYIKVKDPEKFNFSPKQLLNLLTDIYLHLDSNALVIAVATDERSYSKELFNQCIRIMYNKGIKVEVSINNYMQDRPDKY